MFQRVSSGSIGDLTALYTIYLDKKYTVKEFIDTVLENYPNEWGFFRICENDTNRPYMVFEYEQGILAEEIPEKIVNKFIICNNSDGGWTRMDYTIKIGGIK